MTVINAFVQGPAAYLMADTAWSDAEGRMTRYESKVIHGVKWPVAMAITGLAERLSLAEAFNFFNPRNAAQLVEHLPAIVARTVRADKARGMRASLAVTAVAWDKRAKRAAAYICASDRAAFGDLVEPMTVAEVNYAFPGLADLPAALGRHADFTDPLSFDPERDCLTMMEAQRRLLYAPATDAGWKRAFRIGGEAQLVRVTKRGVTVRVVREWPDVIGEMIDPFAAEAA